MILYQLVIHINLCSGLINKMEKKEEVRGKKIMKLVSVVIPVYNVEEYLDDCIKSVITQTYKDLEIILVDDGSTDLSPQICEQYAMRDNRIKVIHQQNKGISVARNVGMTYATGSYIYFLDSDDYIMTNAIRIMYDTIEKENSEIVFCDAETVVNSQKDDLNILTYNRKKCYGSMGGEMLYHLRLNGEFFCNVPFLMINLAYLEKNSLKFYPGIVHEDDLFTVTAFLKADRVTHIHQKLNVRRIRENSIMTGSHFIKSFIGYSTCIQELIPYYKKEQEDSYSKLFLERFCRERMNWIVNGYFNLKMSDQKNENENFAALRSALKTVGFFGDWHAWFKSYFKWINRAHKYIIKKFIRKRC